jgi:hypothetical protein
MPEISELRKLKIYCKKNAGSQKKDNEPGMSPDITIEHH